MPKEVFCPLGGGVKLEGQKCSLAGRCKAGSGQQVEAEGSLLMGEDWVTRCGGESVYNLRKNLERQQSAKAD